MRSGSLQGTEGSLHRALQETLLTRVWAELEKPTGRGQGPG